MFRKKRSISTQLLEKIMFNVMLENERERTFQLEKLRLEKEINSKKSEPIEMDTKDE